MTETIPEKKELAELQKAYSIIEQQIAVIERENNDMMKRLKEY